MRIYPSSEELPREEQLAWKIARVASDGVPLQQEVAGAVIDRIIDDAAVAIAAVNRGPVVSAREMALGNPHSAGATVFGVPSGKRFSPEWAAWGFSAVKRHVAGNRAHLRFRRCAEQDQFG